MKKVCIALLLFFISATAVGCGRKTAVGVCVRHGERETTVALESGLKEDLQAAGYKVITHDAASDQSRQNGQIAKLVEEGCDLIIVEPVMTAAAEEILKITRNADVPVIFLNYAPEESVLDGWENAYYIGSDLTQPGNLQGQLVLQLPDGGDRNGDGSVMCTVIAGPEDHQDATRWSEDCSADFVCLKIDHGDWSRDSGRKLCRRRLTAFDDSVDVIFCNSDKLALGALEALQSEEKEVYLVGIGGDSEALARIREGTMTGTVCENIPALSSCITQTVEAILRDETPQKRQLLDFVIVTKDNLQ